MMDKFGIVNLHDLYKEVVCKKLDKRFRDYQKVRIWHGLAACYALTEKEKDLLADLWRKEKLRRTLMTFKEVYTLMVWFF